MTDDPCVISIVEAEDLGPILRGMEAWDDVFEFQVFPTLTAEDGIARARRELATARA